MAVSRIEGIDLHVQFEEYADWKHFDLDGWVVKGLETGKYAYNLNGYIGDGINEPIDVEITFTEQALLDMIFAIKEKRAGS